MPEIKACLFDLDGVIVDTARYHYRAWKQLANDIGFDITEEDNERLKGVSRMRSLDIILEIGGVELDQKTKVKLAEMKNLRYVEDISLMDKTEILPGVEQFIQELKDSGIKVGLGSASKNSTMILEKINMLHYFDCIVDGNKIENAKPDPEVFLKGAAELNMNPENCAVFEDAIAGVEAARNAGMVCIGIGSVTTLQNADLVMSSFEGITWQIIKEKIINL